MGLNLAQAAMLEGKHVTYLPAYGAEVRGGTANCTVAISDEEIASPVASSPDYVVAMNRPSLDRFQNQVRSGGWLLLNSSLVEVASTRTDIELVSVPASRIAEELGGVKYANMVMLGAFIKKTRLVAPPSVMSGMAEALKGKKSLLAVNEKALMAGYSLF